MEKKHVECKLGQIDAYELEHETTPGIVLRVLELYEQAKSEGYTNLKFKEEKEYYSDKPDFVLYGNRMETDEENQKRIKLEAKQAERDAKRAEKQKEYDKLRRQKREEAQYKKFLKLQEKYKNKPIV